MHLKRLSLSALLVGVSLAGCSVTETLNEKSKVDYRSATKGPALDVPPDLVSPRSDERYKLPSSGDKTLSGFQKGQQAGPSAAPGATGVLPSVDGVRMERQGTQRWLVVNKPPEVVWPMIKAFWVDAGFVSAIDSADTGVFETDWAENRAKIPQDFIRRSIGKVFDSVYDSGTRDKFRTRIERVKEGTEIYLTHRGMEEVFENQRKERLVWMPRAPDPELEAEFLRRLMVRFGAPDAAAVAAVPAPGSAAAAAPAKAEKAVIQGQGADQKLVIAEGFDQSWRQVSLALDRGGFTVEDRDRSKGQFFVRYVDPETQAKLGEKPGFLSKMFGGNKPDQTERYQLNLVRNGEQVTAVTVLDAKGAAVPEVDRPTVGKILNLLRTQLN